MTVISTLISNVCTVHACDSFVTQAEPDGTLTVVESVRTKTVSVKPWKGALSFWGLATAASANWDTYQWLQGRAAMAENYSSAEEFAMAVANDLETDIAAIRFSNSLSRGIGIHFTAYERIHDCDIPELFLISNWGDPSYRTIRKMTVSRETFHTISNQEPNGSHRNFEFRKQVYEFLQAGQLLIYNNGDPLLFNQAANGMFAMFNELCRRGAVERHAEMETWLRLARRPVEAVIQAQRDFASKGKRLVGGKAHALSISPMGEFWQLDGRSPVKRQ